MALGLRKNCHKRCRLKLARSSFTNLLVILAGIAPQLGTACLLSVPLLGLSGALASEAQAQRFFVGSPYSLRDRTISENGGTVILTARLGGTGTIEASIIGDNSSAARVSPTSLVIDADKVNQQYDFRVTGVDDNDVNGTRQVAVLIRVVGSRGHPVPVRIYVTDDDASVTITGAPVAIDSSGSDPLERRGHFRYALDGLPSGTVTATFTSRNESIAWPLVDVIIESDRSFTNGRIDPKLIHLTAPRGASGSTIIDIAFSGGGYDGVTAQVPVRVGTTADVANIPDAGLRGRLEQLLHKESGEAIFRDEIAGLTSFSARNRSITNLTGLEHATGLTELNLGGNHGLADLTPLSGLTSLRRLNLNASNVSNLTPLSGLRNLRRLELVNAAVTNVGPLSRLGELRELFLRNDEGIRDNAIVDVTGLQNLTKLWTLDLRKNAGEAILRSELATLTLLRAVGTSIGNLTGLEYATGLEELYLSGNSISDISALSNLTTLQTLYLDSNSISDISGLSNLTSLRSLALGNNSISDISALSNLTSLRSLALRNNSISDISALSELTTLSFLYLRDNNISDLTPLSGLTALQRLYLNSNSISDIAPLVANMGLGPGDIIRLRGNTLNAAAYSTHIPTLQGRGVTVQFDIIHDANLHTALESALNKNAGEAILSSELATLTLVRAIGASIGNLTGLEYATGLEELYLATA